MCRRRRRAGLRRRGRPAKRRLASAPIAADLRTGTDSPVSRDSSSIKSCDLTRVASAATRSPSPMTMTSPRTTSRPAICNLSPSRTTKARGLARLRSASNTLSLRDSWTIVITTESDAKTSSKNRLDAVAQQQINHAAGDQQREHRLTHHFEENSQHPALLGRRQLVVAVRLEPSRGGRALSPMDGSAPFIAGHRPSAVGSAPATRDATRRSIPAAAAIRCSRADRLRAHSTPRSCRHGSRSRASRSPTRARCPPCAHASSCGKTDRKYPRFRIPEPPFRSPAPI